MRPSSLAWLIGGTVLGVAGVALAAKKPRGCPARYLDEPSADTVAVLHLARPVGSGWEEIAVIYNFSVDEAFVEPWAAFVAAHPTAASIPLG